MTHVHPWDEQTWIKIQTFLPPEMYILSRVGHDQVFSLYAPIPIFKKKIFSDPIIDQILDQNYDQIPIIDPIKNKRHLPKKKHFLQVISFIPLCENEQHI